MQAFARRANKKPAIRRVFREAHESFAPMLVPKGGLEPPRLSALPPQGSASTNSATWAGVLPVLLRRTRRGGNVRLRGSAGGRHIAIVLGRRLRHVAAGRSRGLRILGGRGLLGKT